VKKVTTVLLVYAVLVIASCIFWVWYVMSKSKLTVGGNRGDTHVVADVKKTKQDAEKITAKTTELTSGESDKVDARINDIVKSNDL
jgi:cytoskeletal protein RodZ